MTLIPLGVWAKRVGITWNRAISLAKRGRLEGAIKHEIEKTIWYVPQDLSTPKAYKRK